jgi:hypothetical protein
MQFVLPQFLYKTYSSRVHCVRCKYELFEEVDLCRISSYRFILRPVSPNFSVTLQFGGR